MILLRLRAEGVRSVWPMEAVVCGFGDGDYEWFRSTGTSFFSSFGQKIVSDNKK